MYYVLLGENLVETYVLGVFKTEHEAKKYLCRLVEHPERKRIWIHSATYHIVEVPIDPTETIDRELKAMERY